MLIYILKLAFLVKSINYADCVEETHLSSSY